MGLPNYATCTVWSIFRTLSLYHNELFVGHCRSQTSVLNVWLRHPQSLLVHTVVSNNTMQKIVHVQTLLNLHHIYVLDSIVKFCATGNSAYRLYTYRHSWTYTTFMFWTVQSNFVQLGIQHTFGQLHMSIQSSPTLQTGTW